MIIITSYTNPDIDAIACMYAYSEYLSIVGKNSGYAIFGNIHIEAQFIIDKFDITIDVSSIVDRDDIVLVDMSDIHQVPIQIESPRVIEIIDHRICSHLDGFMSHISIQIEQVGSCATLIVEKFRDTGITPSVASLYLLYGAIMSNTIGLKNQLTTDRDRDAAIWLSQIDTSFVDFTDEMFGYKKIKNDNLHTTCLNNMKIFHLGSIQIGIIQLELPDGEDFFIQYQEELLATISGIRDSRNLSYICISIVDITLLYNIIITPDILIQTILSGSLNIIFRNNSGNTHRIYMRKEIVPYLEAYFHYTL